jgi:hypothetical protein
VTKERGKPVASALAPYVAATVHRSSVLRAPDGETRREVMASFVAGLERLARWLRRLQKPRRRFPQFSQRNG